VKVRSSTLFKKNFYSSKRLRTLESHYVCVCVCNVMYVQMFVHEHILEQLYNKVTMHTCLRIGAL
jgi:hypothetical protein